MANRTSDNRLGMSYPHPTPPLSPSSARPNSGSMNPRQHLHHDRASMPSPPVHRPPHLRGHSDSKQLRPPTLEHAQSHDARRASHMPSSVSIPTDMDRVGRYPHHHLALGSSPQDSCSNSGHSSPMPHSKSSSSKSSHHSANWAVPEAGASHPPQPRSLLNGHTLHDPRASLLHPHARHLDHRPCSFVEPKNLLGSVPTRLASRPVSMSVDSHRIVTGILPSALPIGSRPVPVIVTPTRSMTIQELQQRHKLALQKLQNQSNRAVARDQATVKQAPTAQSANLGSSRTKSPTSPRASASTKAETPTLPEKLTKVEKPTKVENTSKEEKVAKAENSSKRKSILSFFSSKQPGSSRAAEEKAAKTETKDEETVELAQESDEDEDVPLAQLRRTNRAARPTKPPQSPSARRPPLSHLAAPGQPDRSMSAPGQRRPLSHRSTRSNSVGVFAPIPEDPNQGPGLAHSPRQRVRPLSQLSHEIIDERLTRSMGHNIQGLVSPGMMIGTGSSGAAGAARGPRPAILEAEEKALRNSRRAVAGLSGVNPQMLEGPSQLQPNNLPAPRSASRNTIIPGELVKDGLDKWLRY